MKPVDLRAIQELTLTEQAPLITMHGEHLRTHLAAQRRRRQTQRARDEIEHAHGRGDAEP